MNRYCGQLFNVRALLKLILVLFAAGPLHAQSLDEVHKAALKEGGTLNFYGTLAQINAEKILPIFEKRFPGIKVNHIDATSDKLVARAVSEARRQDAGRRLPGSTGKCGSAS